MEATKRLRRNVRKARPVLVHPDLHLLLATAAREEGYSIQGRLHLLLCREFGRPDLAESIALSAAAAS